ncbi:MAG: hypothetical protein EOO78_22150 [Oxalobacteraceae bacterium]|jgi:hypothetical protein|nr:MAG: hypothetical protein EOO78_22150 [Oxalobacteraceae bacterium]
MRPLWSTAALLAVLALSACGERDQAMSAGRHGSPDEPWRGAQNGFVVKTWTPTDKAGWETQLRQRAQRQNEYNNTN